MVNFQDRVKENTFTSGTGNITLSGAVQGYRTFSSAFQVNDVIQYCITNGTAWEIGQGTLVSTTELSRDTVLSSSTGSKIVFSTDQKEIFCTLSAEYITGNLATQTYVGTAINTSNSIPKTSLVNMSQVGLLGGVTGAVGEISLNNDLKISGSTLSLSRTRIAVSDADYAITTTADLLLSYASITSTRVVTLPSANITNQKILVIDESGTCSPTAQIKVTAAGSDVIRSTTYYNILSPYGVLELVSNGSGRWDLVAYDKYLSAGCLVQPTYTDNNNGTLTLNSDGVYALYRNVAGTGNISAFIINGSGTTFTCTDGVTNYIVANYNNGSPVIQCITNVSLINETTIIPILTAYRGGNYLHILDWDTLGDALVNKLHQSVVKTQRYRLESGLTLGETGTRNVTIGSGVVWVGAASHSVGALDSTTDNIFFCYRSAGSWTTSVVHQYNNSQYDNGTNLVSLNPNTYAVSFIYRGIEVRTECYMTLGSASYNTLAEAAASQPPSPPPLISSHAILVGRIIVSQGASTASQIDSAFATTFTGTAATVHNNLSGLQGGQASEYYHLTSSQYTNATNTSTSSHQGLLPTLSNTETDILTGVGTWVTQSNGLTSASKTSSFTSSKGYRYFASTSTGAITGTLPASPSVGDTIEFFDGSSTWATNNFTILRNGLKLNGLAEDFICDVSNVGIRVVYVNSTIGWRVSAEITL